MQPSIRYTLLFAAGVCLVCSILVSTAAVLLKDQQAENRLLDRRKNVLSVVGLAEPGESLSDEEINERFAAIESRVIELETGEFAEDVDPLTFDQRRAAQDDAMSEPAPANLARVNRVPHHALIYLLEGEDPSGGAVILPIEGYGLWGTLYGYIALERDGRTVRGLTFYEHKETPGLGGEVDSMRWKALWPGRKVTDETGEPRIEVVKGSVGLPTADPYRVDGLSGATLTSNGVTNMLRFWLGDEGFGPFLERYRAQHDEAAASAGD